MTESETESNTLWEPVSNDEYNDYPLAFVNVSEDSDEVMLNIDGEDVEPNDGEGPMVQGTYKGLQDISAEDNPKPSMKHLVESEKDERTYAFNNVSSLSNEEGNGGLDQVEEGDVVGINFEGWVRPDDDTSLPWQNFEVLRPAQ